MKILYLLLINLCLNRIQINYRNKFKFFSYNSYFYNKYNFTIFYNYDDITKMLIKNSLPQKYYFFNNYNCPKIIKNQEKCESCWSFASTTMLSYRFCQKYNLSINLSPQYGISCLSKTCGKSVTIYDTFDFLSNFGTVSEDCYKYTAFDGTTIGKCMDKCNNNIKNNSFKKFYSKNFNTNIEEYFDCLNNNKNYIFLIEKIIKELIKNGPVFSIIKLPKDFSTYFSNNKEGIYSNIPEYYEEYHAVVIIGYGHTKDKYFWLIQNSWGKEFGNEGIAKIEFGKIGIEMIGYSSPSYERFHLDVNKYMIILIMIFYLILIYIFLINYC